MEQRDVLQQQLGLRPFRTELCVFHCGFFVCKQRTAYEVCASGWRGFRRVFFLSMCTDYRCYLVTHCLWKVDPTVFIPCGH